MEELNNFKSIDMEFFNNISKIIEDNIIEIRKQSIIYHKSAQVLKIIFYICQILILISSAILILLDSILLSNSDDKHLVKNMAISILVIQFINSIIYGFKTIFNLGDLSNDCSNISKLYNSLGDELAIELISIKTKEDLTVGEYKNLVLLYTEKENNIISKSPLIFSSCIWSKKNIQQNMSIGLNSKSNSKSNSFTED